MLPVGRGKQHSKVHRCPIVRLASRVDLTAKALESGLATHALQLLLQHGTQRSKGEQLSSTACKTAVPCHAKQVQCAVSSSTA